MRLLSARYRTSVHETEDEARVREALLWVMAQLGEKGAEHRVTRQKTKGHYGNDILILEAILKQEKAIGASLQRIFSEASMRQRVQDSLLKRIDEDGVLYVRLDKQASVERRLDLTDSGDAILVHVKAAMERVIPPPTQWHRYLATFAPIAPEGRAPFSRSPS